jgi:predicted aconitase
LAGLAATAAVVLPHVAGATPGQPTLQEVKNKLDQLARKNEVLSEQYNKATAEVKAQQKAAAPR